MAQLEVEERAEEEGRSPQTWVKINSLSPIIWTIESMALIKYFSFDLGVLVLFGPGVIPRCRRVQ